MTRARSGRAAEPPTRTWRPPGIDGIVCIAGRTSRYAIEPFDEYVIAVVESGAMRATQGRRHHDVRAGDVVRWDPGSAHRGHALAGDTWSARLLLVELPALRRWALDEDDDRHPALTFDRPVLRDPALAARIAGLHRELEDPADLLAAQTTLLDVAQAVVAGPPAGLVPARGGRVARVARDYLEAHVDRNVSLDELAAVCGVGRFRLVREFSAQVGIPPHRYLLARRLALARRGLEAGADVSQLAADLGFADQSHLHRHFRRAFATTPAAYRRAFATR